MHWASIQGLQAFSSQSRYLTWIGRLSIGLFGSLIEKEKGKFRLGVRMSDKPGTPQAKLS